VRDKISTSLLCAEKILQYGAFYGEVQVDSFVPCDDAIRKTIRNRDMEIILYSSVPKFGSHSHIE